MGQTVTLALTATDPTGDPLTYSATNLPPGLTINSSTGVIAGTFTAASAGRFSVNAGVSDGFSTAYQTFVWDVNPLLSAFALWQSTTPGAGTDPHSDLDSDGSDDLLEYAFNGSPASGATPAMTLQRDASAAAGNLAVTYRRPAGGRAGVSYVLQCSNTLTAWEDVTTVIPTVTPNGDGTETVRYEHLEAVPVAGGTRWMLRVTVRLVP